MGSDSLVGQGDEYSAATAAATADLSRRLESVNASLDKSQRHLALAKEKEAVQAKELKLAREELAKKSYSWCRWQNAPRSFRQGGLSTAKGASRDEGHRAEPRN